MQQWRKLKICIVINKEIISISQVHAGSGNSSYNALQYACHYHPPIDVINCLYNADHKAISEINNEGQYALHIACAQGCSPIIIKYLLEKYPPAAEKTDLMGQTPFLLACKSYLRKNQQSRKVANKELLEVLQVLSAIASISFLEDNNDKAPIEYLFEAEADELVTRYVNLVTSNLRQSMTHSNHNKKNIDGFDRKKKSVLLTCSMNNIVKQDKTKKDPQARAA